MNRVPWRSRKRKFTCQICVREKETERERKKKREKKDHSDLTKMLTLLNVVLLAEGKESDKNEVDALHHLANGNSRQDVKHATRILGSARVSGSYSDNARRGILLLELTLLAVITYAENSRPSWLLTTRVIKHVDYQSSRRLSMIRFAHNNNIIGYVARHEWTWLGQLRQLRSPPVVILYSRT